MKIESIDILIISLFLISLMGILIISVLICFQSKEMYEQDIKINQLEKELDKCVYLNKQIITEKYLTEYSNVNVYYGADKNTFNNIFEVLYIYGED